MAGYDGNGNWARQYSWTIDAANAVPISASRMDTEWTFIAAGFNNCLTRDGQGKPSAAIDWNGQNLTGVNDLTVNGTLTVSSITLTTLAVTANATVGGTFGATGNATFGGTLAVTGAATVTGALTASAAASVGTTLAVGTNATVGGTLAITGTTSAARLNATKVVASGAAYTPSSAIAAASTTTIDCTASNVFAVSMGANIAALTVSNPADGQTINVFFTQDATGSRTISWPASFKWAGGSVPALTTTASRVDLLVATYLSATGFWYAGLTKDIR